MQSEFTLTCNHISHRSMKYEGSDFAILPAQFKPKKANVFGSYIFKVRSNLSNHWTYCRVKDWTAEDHNCYLPTWMMNYLNIPEKLEVLFTYDRFSIKNAESLVIQPTDEIFASYSFLVELNAIRKALQSYHTLTNNSRVVLNVDGQTFFVIIRLLKPEEKVRTNSRMNIVVAKNVYKKHGVKAADEAKKYEDMNISQDTTVTDLLSGLCLTCYRPLAECQCKEKKAITAINRTATKEEEEENRRIALETLQNLYCMNCFKLHKDCTCSPAELTSLNMNQTNKKPVESTNIDTSDDIEECTLQDEDFDIMQIVEQEMIQNAEERRKEKERKRAQRRQELEAAGQSKEQAYEMAAAEIQEESENEDQVEKAEEEEAEEEEKAQKENEKLATEESDNQETERYCYWPILPNEHCHRWNIPNSILIPPPPPDVCEKNVNQIIKKNSTLWSFFKRYSV